MVSYVSPELTAKLRSQRKAIREALSELRRDVPGVPIEQIPARLAALDELHRSHDALVDALMEALEPDEFFVRDDI